jgi:hypothetical protein
MPGDPADAPTSRFKQSLRRERVALAASTDAARQAAAKAAGDEFGARLRLAFEEMQWMLAGRSPRDLHPREMIIYMVAREHFNALMIAQQRFADAKLARLIDAPQ